jgi:hypothetical protein
MVIGAKNPLGGEDAGKKWFENLSEENQKEYMGNAKYDAWKDGKITLDQLSVEKENEVYGLMRGEASLKEILGNEAKDYYSYDNRGATETKTTIEKPIVEQKIKETPQTKTNEWGESSQYANEQARKDWG